MPDNISERLRFYRQHLEEDVVSWWVHNAIDEGYGGVFTFWDSAGKRRLSDDKYVWSQGRWAWTAARLAKMATEGRVDSDLHGPMLNSAIATMRLLSEVELADGTCANFVTREGEPTTGFTGERLHTSVFADLFVVLGLAGVAALDDSDPWASRGKDLLVRAAARIAAGVALTEPYPVPEGFTGFAQQMILVNTATELYGVLPSEDVAAIAADAAHQVLARYAPDGDICELLPLGEADRDTLQARHRNPGHALEAIWFLVEAAEKVPAVADRLGPGLNQRLADAFVLAATRGWDSAHGGLLRFVDASGGKPAGRALGGHYEEMVSATWDLKLWWPHNDALYAALLLWSRTDDPRLLDWFERLDAYAFSRFPAGPGREWRQILTRSGVPREPDARAALPVKDPYHLIRSLALLIDLGYDTHNCGKEHQ